MPELLGLGGNKDAKRAAEANQRTQMAALAREQGQSDQATAIGGKKRGGRMLEFARSLSGEGQGTLG